ncbi:MAG: hypothetical protein FJ090_17990 [Deltaproteobacteria bacterium]|nr:hypothetical protein [Deltaproteobacteria bacterium]
MVGVCALLLAPASLAAEFRHVLLLDGRTVVGEVIDTTSRGVELRTPQGHMRIPIADVNTMRVATPAEWSGQRDLRVLVAPVWSTIEPAANPGLDTEIATAHVRAALARVPRVDVVVAEGPTARAAAACGLDLTCARTAFSALDIDVFVVGAVGSTTGQLDLALASGWTDAPAASRRVSMLRAPGAGALGGGGFGDEVEMDAAARALLGLVPGPLYVAAPPVAPVAATRSLPPRDGPLVDARLYVPLPGYPAFADGKPARGLLAVAIAVPAATAMTYAAGTAAAHRPELVTAAIVGSYASVVLANVMTN